MYASILTIGDEILIGQIVNTNAAFMARQLNLIGVQVKNMLSVGDNKTEITQALKKCGDNTQLVLITGGLGPTSDDITKPALCEYFNSDMRFDQKVFEMVEAFLQKRSGTMNSLNKAQAYVPTTAKIIYNPIGTAPGLWFEKNGIVYVSMPGVPFEMEKMMLEQIIPAVKKQYSLGQVFHKTVLTTGIPESKLALTIENWEKQLPGGIKLAYLPSPGMVKLRLSVYDNPQAETIVAKEISKLQEIIGDAIWGFDSDTMESVVGNLLKEKQQTIGTAESCTGGNIARLITSIPGSSSYFKGSVVSYANEIKSDLLEVPTEVINSVGAVSQKVVEAMVKGALKALKTDYAIAVSGVAGPDGGTPEKPVGTVWIAVGNESKIISQKFLVGDNRDRNIQISSQLALNMARKFILNAS